MMPHLRSRASASTPEVSPRSSSGARLLIVSNRLPVTVHAVDGRANVTPSVGGLATGLRKTHERPGGLWIGWPGSLDGLSDAARTDAMRQLEEKRTIPVGLTAREIRGFYERFSNGILWPLCHDRIDQMPLRVRGWDAYESVNERFADTVASVHRDGDLIWVHDYHLMRLPALLRARLPRARIGFFLHVPFPAPDILFALPMRRALVDGLLGADVIGFHTRRYRGHFASALRRLLDIEMGPDAAITHGGRRIQLGVFPMGIDADDFAARASSREVTHEVLGLRSPTQRLIVGIDRLDYSKGIARRLLAIERLLETRPEWRGHLRLVQVAVPSRSRVTAYRRLRHEVDRLVGRINGRFGTPAWTPVHYLYRSVNPTTLSALYRTADVMLVTPLRDGMNLVAKEFVASRTDEGGVLVLSEFAGAAAELTDALLVNPYDVDGVADAMHHALTMDAIERRRRMVGLRSRVLGHDIHHWTASFLDALAV